MSEDIVKSILLVSIFCKFTINSPKHTDHLETNLERASSGQLDGKAELAGSAILIFGGLIY